MHTTATRSCRTPSLSLEQLKECARQETSGLLSLSTFSSIHANVGKNLINPARTARGCTDKETAWPLTCCLSNQSHPCLLQALVRCPVSPLETPGLSLSRMNVSNHTSEQPDSFESGADLAQDSPLSTASGALLALAAVPPGITCSAASAPQNCGSPPPSRCYPAPLGLARIQTHAKTPSPAPAG